MSNHKPRNLICDDYNYLKIGFETARDRLIATGLTDYAAVDRLWLVENGWADEDASRYLKMYGGEGW